jgi:hypothetical protein
MTSAMPTELPTLQEEMANLQDQLEVSRAESELYLLQLQEVMKELEICFLAHQEQLQLLKQYQQEQRRAEVLIAAMLERIEASGA